MFVKYAAHDGTARYLPVKGVIFKEDDIIAVTAIRSIYRSLYPECEFVSDAELATSMNVEWKKGKS